jgi:hypothetical protein
MASVYLSYSHMDSEFARKLTADLRTAGVRVWVDESELKIGDAFVEKMQKGIDEADYLAVLISPNSVNSTWVRRELELALTRPDLKVLPLLIGDCNLPPELKGKLYGDFRNPLLYEKKLLELFSAIDTGQGSHPTGAAGHRGASGSHGAPEQSLSAGKYALLSLGALAIAIGLLVFYVNKVPDIVSRGVQHQVFYVLLIPWALASAGFLFGTMRSFALFSGKSAGRSLELGGPVVLFCLVIIGGFKLVPVAADSFDITLRAHASDGTAPIITSGSATIDLDNDRRTSAFNSAGEAEFKGIPARFQGANVRILPRVNGYEEVWQSQALRGRALDIELVRASPLTNLRGSLVPAPARPKSIRILVDGQRAEATPDGFGRFEIEVSGKAGDQVRLKVYSADKLIYDDYQTLPGPVTLRTRRAR